MAEVKTATTATSEVNANQDLTPLVNGAKLIGDLGVLPGVSLALDGDLKRGAIHAGVAIGAMVVGGLLAPAVILATALNSYSTSVTGKNLIEQYRTRV